MKKQIHDTSILDFETGNVAHDNLAEWRNYQLSLSSLDNSYHGNKRKLIVDIVDELAQFDINYQTVVDVFSGSSACSIFFKLIGKNVFCNDLLTSSYYNALAFVVNSKQNITEEQIAYLCGHSNDNKGDFVRREYSDRFTEAEALFLDNYRANVDSISEGDLILKAIAIVLIEHYVMRNCFLGGRLNKGQILAELSHRIEHIRNGGQTMDFRLSPLKVFESNVDCHAYNMDAIEFLKLPFQADLAYIDPPYGGGQSDYASMFAFCEEYIYSQKIKDLPHLNNSKKFVSKKDYKKHFCSLLEGCERFPYWAISYNDSSWSDVSSITDIVKKYRSNIKVVEIDYAYKYRKQDSDPKEYLLLAK